MLDDRLLGCLDALKENLPLPAVLTVPLPQEAEDEVQADSGRDGLDEYERERHAATELPLDDDAAIAEAMTQKHLRPMTESPADRRQARIGFAITILGVSATIAAAALVAMALFALFGIK